LREYGEWNRADLEVLELALAAVDRAAACRRRIKREGLLLVDRIRNRRVMKPHPLLAIERRAAAFATAAFKMLDLKGPDGDA
jgi:hypothetical protein